MGQEATRALPPKRRWRRLARTVPPASVQSSLTRLAADLHRLEQEYRRIEASREMAREKRLRAIGLAYDDTLRACSHCAGLPTPERSPLSPIDRLQTEAALVQAGITW